MLQLFSPALVLSTVLASGYSFAAHFFWGRSYSQLARYWMIAVLGFGLGQLIAAGAGWQFAMIGEVHLIEGTFVAWSGLVVAKLAKL